MDWPPPEEEPEIEYHVVARLADVVAGRPTVRRIGVKLVALFRIDDEIFATSNTCPHAGGPLSAGELRGTRITCPRHGWCFDVATGACPEHPIYELRTYPVDVRGQDIYVGVEKESW